jgi:hypothetical protein
MNPEQSGYADTNKPTKTFSDILTVAMTNACVKGAAETRDCVASTVVILYMCSTV